MATLRFHIDGENDDVLSTIHMMLAREGRREKLHSVGSALPSATFAASASLFCSNPATGLAYCRIPIFYHSPCCPHTENGQLFVSQIEDTFSSFPRYISYTIIVRGRQHK